MPAGLAKKNLPGGIAAAVLANLAPGAIGQRYAESGL